MSRTSLSTFKLPTIKLLLAGFCLFSVLSASLVEASSPQLSLINPRGVQRGTTRVLDFTGARLDDAKEILFYDEGVKADKIEAVNANHIKVTLTVAADCRPGEHIAQVRCDSGISDFRSFWVGNLKEVAEVEPNSSFDEPQPIEMNVTVEGIAQTEDVDYYVVEAKAGDRISAEVEAIRLGTYLFDPYVAILDEKRFELSADDDTPLLKQDSLASIIAPADGKYYIQIRETSYGGNGNCRYRMHVGTFPRPTAVYPAGGKKGEEIDVNYIGDVRGPIPAKLKVPTETGLEYGVFAKDGAGEAPSWVPFRPTDLGNTLEQEPNNDLSQATPADLQNAFNGIISEPGDIDCFKFAAKKGQVLDIECYARRIRSGLDPVINLYNSKNQGLGGNDDSRGPDSYLRYTIPADDEYIIRVTDHLSRGQGDFVYRIELTPPKASLTMQIPPVARYSQYRQAIFVARGNRFATLMNVARKDFGGPIVAEANDLPPGVKMIAETMTPNVSQMPIVFEAAADAPIGGKLIDFRGKHAENAEINGGYFNSAYFVRGQNNQMFISGDVDRLPVVVVNELPYTLEIVQPTVPLVKNGTMNVKIVAHRKEGFTKPIKVEWPFRPPGVGVTQSVQIPEGQSECYYPINANGNAPIQTWPVYVLGSSDEGGQVWVSSQLAKLEIAEPYVNVVTQRTSTEQGKPTQLFCTIEVAKPFEGEAQIEVVGLPNLVTTEAKTFNKDSKELVFDVKTDPTSPAGKHKTVFCRVKITQNGEEIVSSTGQTELQIDKPLPAPVQPAPKKEEPKVAQAKPVEKPAKPLSRLEKLRLEAKNAKASQ